MGRRVVIIGSGLGGLSCGAILSRNGYDVTVLEQGPVPGGCLQCFSRAGVKFETGMHFVGSARPGEPLDRIMRYLGVRPYVELSQLDPSGYDRVSLLGKQYSFANGREAFIDTLLRDFPACRRDLESYCNLIEEVASASAMQTLDFASADSAMTMEYQSRSVGEVISSVVKDSLLAKVLAGTSPLYAGIEEETPFATHAFITSFYNRSAFRFVGGSDSLANAFVRVIEDFGGRVLTSRKVTKIVCDDARATGVIASDVFMPADYVISDAHPARTLELLDTSLIRPAYRSRIKAMPQTVGAFSVYIKFKEGAVPYMAHNEYIYSGNTPWGCEKYTQESWPGGLIYMHMCHQPNPVYARSGILISYMNMDDVRQWVGTPVGRRGADYEDFKREKAEKVLDLLESHRPGTRTGIEKYWTSTPLTYRDYTGTEEGAMYGVERSIHGGPERRVTYRTRIPNLLLTGQNTNSHGIMGVLVGSFMTCGELLSPGTIIRQIKEMGI